MGTVKAHIRPRPIRVAFLIEEQEYWRPTLDAIFADCFGRWGGRFNLLVPCADRVIRPSYLPWLEHYDPDIIYSYVDLADDEISLIHERFYPAFLVRHNFVPEHPRDQHAFRPRLPVDALGSLSVVLGDSREHSLSPRQPIDLIDIQNGEKPSQFIQENFGYYGESLAPYLRVDDMTDLVRTVTVVPEQTGNNSKHWPRASGEFVTHEKELLKLISTEKNLVGLSQLSAWQCPRIEFHDNQWVDSVNLVVGDSFVDSIVFWNARSHLPVWLDRGLVTLKTTMEQLDDPEFFSMFLGMIRNRVRVRTGNSSHTHFKIRSATAPQSYLETLREKFQAEDGRHLYSAEARTTLDSCVPSSSALENHRWLTDGIIWSGQDWHEIPFSESVFRPPLVYPRHLRDVRPMPSFAGRGGWALDVDIQRTVDHSRFQNVQHRWHFPFRLRIVDAFLKRYLPTGNAPICIPRATGRGFLGLFGFVDGQLPEITVPTDEAVFRTALCASRTGWPFDSRRHETLSRIAVDIRPSDKGRYLTALLGRGGGIHRTAEVFLQQFWNEQFDKLGATTSAADSQLEEIAQRLHARNRGRGISSLEDWRRIAAIVRLEARNIRFPNRYLRFDKLTEDFELFRNAFWEKNQAVSPREDWDDDERHSLSESVQYLCQREILYQGHEWRCPRCYNKNWVSLSDLGPSMKCEVCNHTSPAPVTDPWHFKLDTFVLEGLREHSMLSYLWCLNRLANEARDSFFFLEPHELFFTEEAVDRRRADAEIDMLTIGDGVVRLCEIKSADRNLDIDKFADLAKRIRPNIATLAVMERSSTALLAKRSELEAALGSTGITAEMICLQNEDIDPSTILANGRQCCVRF